MKRTTNLLRTVCLLIVICMLCSTTLPASAIVVSPDFAPTNTVLYSTSAENASVSMLNLLNTHDVDYNDSSTIFVESTGTEAETSLLHVTTKHGDTIVDTVFVGYNENSRGVYQRSNFAAELISPNDSGSGPILFADVLVQGVTVYTRTTNNSNVYVRPTGQKITCYDYGGTLPSSIKVNTQIQGSLCSSNFSVVDDDYAYNHPFNKISPVFGTTYTQNGSPLASTRWIKPTGDASYRLRLQAVINGKTYSDTVGIYSWVG